MSAVCSSQCRSEARAVLQAAANKSNSQRVASLYALALIDAEGGHYDQAVSHAQQALEAADKVEQQESAWEAAGPIVALLALLLSARSALLM